MTYDPYAPWVQVLVHLWLGLLAYYGVVWSG